MVVNNFFQIEKEEFLDEIYLLEENGLSEISSIFEEFFKECKIELNKSFNLFSFNKIFKKGDSLLKKLLIENPYINNNEVEIIELFNNVISTINIQFVKKLDNLNNFEKKDITILKEKLEKDVQISLYNDENERKIFLDLLNFRNKIMNEQVILLSKIDNDLLKFFNSRPKDRFLLSKKLDNNYSRIFNLNNKIEEFRKRHYLNDFLMKDELEFNKSKSINNNILFNIQERINESIHYTYKYPNKKYKIPEFIDERIKQINKELLLLIEKSFLTPDKIPNNNIEYKINNIKSLLLNSEVNIVIKLIIEKEIDKIKTKLEEIEENSLTFIIFKTIHTDTVFNYFKNNYNSKIKELNLQIKNNKLEEIEKSISLIKSLYIENIDLSIFKDNEIEKQPDTIIKYISDIKNTFEIELEDKKKHSIQKLKETYTYLKKIEDFKEKINQTDLSKYKEVVEINKNLIFHLETNKPIMRKLKLNKIDYLSDFKSKKKIYDSELKKELLLEEKKKIDLKLLKEKENTEIKFKNKIKTIEIQLEEYKEIIEDYFENILEITQPDIQELYDILDNLKNEITNDFNNIKNKEIEVFVINSFKDKIKILKSMIEDTKTIQEIAIEIISEKVKLKEKKELKEKNKKTLKALIEENIELKKELKNKKNTRKEVQKIKNIPKKPIIDKIEYDIDTKDLVFFEKERNEYFKNNKNEFFEYLSLFISKKPKSFIEFKKLLNIDYTLTNKKEKEFLEKFMILQHYSSGSEYLSISKDLKENFKFQKDNFNKEELEKVKIPYKSFKIDLSEKKKLTFINENYEIEIIDVENILININRKDKNMNISIGYVDIKGEKKTYTYPFTINLLNIDELFKLQFEYMKNQNKNQNKEERLDLDLDTKFNIEGYKYLHDIETNKSFSTEIFNIFSFLDNHYDVKIERAKIIEDKRIENLSKIEVPFQQIEKHEVDLTEVQKSVQELKKYKIKKGEVSIEDIIPFKSHAKHITIKNERVLVWIDGGIKGVNINTRFGDLLVDKISSIEYEKVSKKSVEWELHVEENELRKNDINKLSTSHKAERFVFEILEHFSKNGKKNNNKDFNFDETIKNIKNLDIKSFSLQLKEIILLTEKQVKDFELLKLDAISILKNSKLEIIDNNGYEIKDMNYLKKEKELKSLQNDNIEEGGFNYKGYDFELKTQEKIFINYKYKDGKAWANISLNVFNENLDLNFKKRQMYKFTDDIDDKIKKHTNIDFILKDVFKEIKYLAIQPQTEIIKKTIADKINELSEVHNSFILEDKFIPINNPHSFFKSVNKIILNYIKSGKNIDDFDDFIDGFSYFGKSSIKTDLLLETQYIVRELYRNPSVNNFLQKKYNIDLGNNYHKKLKELITEEIIDYSEIINNNNDKKMIFLEKILHLKSEKSILISKGDSIELPNLTNIKKNLKDIKINISNFKEFNTGVYFDLSIKLKDKELFNFKKNTIKTKSGSMTGTISVDMSGSKDIYIKNEINKILENNINIKKDIIKGKKI